MIGNPMGNVLGNPLGNPLGLPNRMGAEKTEIASYTRYELEPARTQTITFTKKSSKSIVFANLRTFSYILSDDKGIEGYFNTTAFSDLQNGTVTVLGNTTSSALKYVLEIYEIENPKTYLAGRLSTVSSSSNGFIKRGVMSFAKAVNINNMQLFYGPSDVIPISTLKGPVQLFMSNDTTVTASYTIAAQTSLFKSGLVQAVEFW